MLRHFLTQRQEALLTLMEREDPIDLPNRRHRWKWRRAKNPDQLKQQILLAWWARREIESKPPMTPRLIRFQRRLLADQASGR